MQFLQVEFNKQNNINTMKKTVLMIAAIWLSFNAMNAQVTLKGKVLDAVDKHPLTGATIKIKGQSQHAVSNEKGEFRFDDLTSEVLRLSVRHIGYQMKEVEVGNIAELLTIELLPDVQMLGEFVVTATRSNRDLYDIPVRVSLVSKENTEEVPALSVDDYLRVIPGISVSRGAGFLGSATISMRGMGSEAGRTLVMLDGVPINKSDGGSVNWNAVNLNEIGKIEVLKGPGSSIYGGNAMGGVINMISPTPVEPLEGSISQSLGTFATAHTQAKIGSKQENFFWGLHGMYRQSDGYITTPADEIDDYSIASFLNEYQFGGRAGYFIKPEQMLEIAGGYYSGERGTGSKFSGYGFTNDDLAAGDGAYNLYTNINGRVLYRSSYNERQKLNITLFGQRENYQNIRESLRNETITRYDVESIRDEMGILSSFSTQFGSAHQITTGVDLRNGAVDGADVYLTSTDKVLNQGKMNQLGIYLQDEIQIGSTPFSILAGLRFDYVNFYDGAFIVENPTSETKFLQDFDGDLNDASFSALSPRISVQYHNPQKFRIFGGYSRGFRAPVLDDMCRTGRISGGMKIANPDLKPEYLDNFEIGSDIFIAKRITLSPGLFYAIGTDYHAYIATGDSLLMNNRMRPIRIKDNIGKVNIMGAEVALNLEPVDGLNINLAYTYTDTEIVEHRVLDPAVDDDLAGKDLVYEPKDILHAGISWRNKYINVYASFNHKGVQWLNDLNTEKIESFNYIDLHVWRQLYRGLSAAVKVHNLLDQDFVDSRNVVAPGRMITGELRFSF
jgi:outer membrane receptor protein involved in Fe transport